MPTIGKLGESGGNKSGEGWVTLRWQPPLPWLPALPVPYPSYASWPGRAAGMNRAPRGATEELDYIFPDFTCTLAIIIEAATGIACWCLAVPEAALPRVCHKGASECGLLVSSQHARMMPP